MDSVEKVVEDSLLLYSFALLLLLDQTFFHYLIDCQEPFLFVTESIHVNGVQLSY